MARRSETSAPSARSPSPGSSRASRLARDEVGLEGRRRVTELDPDDAVTGDGAEKLTVRTAAKEVPRVQRQAAVGPSGLAHDVPRRLEVRDVRPREEFELHEQASLGRPVTEVGEGIGGVVERPGATEDVDGVDRAGADGVGHREQLLRAEGEDAFGVELGRDPHLGGPRWPVPGGVDLGHRQAVAAQHGDDVGVTPTLGPGVLVVAAPQRNGVESARPGRRQALSEGDAGTERARAQHGLFGSQGHDALTIVALWQ